MPDRITSSPSICGGRPCIRGMRIRVSDVLDLYGNGLNHDEILEELPDLELEDLMAVMKYISKRIDHPTFVA